MQSLRVDLFPTKICALLLDDLVNFVKTLVLETLNSKDRCLFSRRLGEILKTLLQLFVIRFLPDRLDYLLETVATDQSQKTLPCRPVLSGRLYSCGLQ